MLNAVYVAAALATEHAPAEEAPNPIIPIWQELVIGGIAFAVLCFVLIRPRDFVAHG